MKNKFYNFGAWSYLFDFGPVCDALTFLLDNISYDLAQCWVDKL